MTVYIIYTNTAPIITPLPLIFVKDFHFFNLSIFQFNLPVLDVRSPCRRSREAAACEVI